MTGKYDVMYNGAPCGELNITENGLLTVLDCVCAPVSDSVLRLFCVTDANAIPAGVMMPAGTSLRFHKSFSKSALGALGAENAKLFALAKSADELMPKAHEPEPETVPEAVPSSEPEQEPEPEQELPLNSEPEGVPESVNTPGVESMPEADTVPENEILPENEAVPEVESSPKAEIVPESEVIPDVKAIPEVEIMPEIETAPNDESTPESTPVPDTWWRKAHEPWRLFRDADTAEACRETKGALLREEDGKTLLAVPFGGDEPFPMMPVFRFGEQEMINGAPYIVFTVENGRLSG